MEPVKKEDIVIAIPVYKAEMNAFELISFRQCLNILNRYRIVLVKPHSLDIAAYQRELPAELSLGTVSFDDHYFKDIAGYNRLLLSETFYQQFSKFRYLLIYQLDAYVFRDELQEWCNKGYDYVGAPVIYNYSTQVGTHVGNGGFSLRKVSKFLDAFEYSGKLFKYRQAKKRVLIDESFRNQIKAILMITGWHNSFKFIIETWQHNEDDFWSWFLEDSNFLLHKPGKKEAIGFAFERYPSECFEEANQSLPFGCHAWEKYEYESFWKNYIR